MAELSTMSILESRSPYLETSHLQGPEAKPRASASGGTAAKPLQAFDSNVATAVGKTGGQFTGDSLLEYTALALCTVTALSCKHDREKVPLQRCATS